MKALQFKTLMYGNIFVDLGMLEKGIYGRDIPSIFEAKETMETLTNRFLAMKDYTGKCFLSETYFENLKECELVDIEIIIKNI